MNFYVKVFVSKAGRKSAALCMNGKFISFDKLIVLEALNIAPADLENLEVGEYNI